METRITYRIPVEQYAFVEVVEAGTRTDEEIQQRYNELTDAFRPKPINSLPDKEMNQFVDRMLNGESGNHIEQYEQMSPMQQFAIQCIKRGIKRLEAKK